MKYSTLAVCFVTVANAASVVSNPNGLENPAVAAPAAVPAKPKELHPNNFGNIQAAHAFHDLIRNLYPYVENSADLAGIEMKDLLDGTPFDWDAHFNNTTTQIERRSFLEAVPLMTEVSRVLLNFIARTAAYSHHDMISNIAETLADYMG